MSTCTTAVTSARQQTHAIRHPHLLLDVMTWELRRFRASRIFWIQALCFFALLLFVLWARQAPDQYYFGPNLNGFVAGTSAWGLLEILPPDLVLLLGLLLPFVTADGVTRDLKRGTHELLMTTAVPSWAYVWGRFLTSLLMSLGLAVMLLAALLGMGELLHLTNSAYPSPQVGTVLLLWGGMVVPATVLVSSLGFALGTLFPRQSTLVKIGILVAWAVGAYVIPIMLYFPSGPNHLPTGYSSWDPTSALTGLVMFSQYNADAHQLSSLITNTAQLQHLLNTIANKVPDSSTWLAPHLLLAGLSLLLVALAAFSFQRFRNAFGA